MHYTFNEKHSRDLTGSMKWDRRPPKMKQAGFFPMSYADMDLQTAPEIREALVRAAQRGIFGYTDPDEEYLRAVTGWLQTRHGFAVGPDSIVCTGGVLPAINAAICTFTKPGDKVIVQKPGYYLFDKGIMDHGRVVSENPLRIENGRYVMDFDDLAQKAADPQAKMLILCSPHNPTGRVWTYEELKTLGEICMRNGVLVVSDEIHFDIVYPPHRHTAFASISEEFGENSITCTSPSKTFNLAGLKSANIIISNEKMRTPFKQYFDTGGHYHIGYFARDATIAAYRQGVPWMEAMLAHVRENYDYFARFLRREIPGTIPYPLEGTYLAWTDCRALGLAPEALEQFMLYDAQLALNEGVIFGTGGGGFERWNLALPRPALAENLSRLADAVKKLWQSSTTTGRSW